MKIFKPTTIFYLLTTSRAFYNIGSHLIKKRPTIMLKSRVTEKSLTILYTPKTSNQQKYYEFLKNDDVNIVVCSGPAGSGKTALACHYAIEKYKQGVFKKIIITRPLVTVEEDIGFLPGTLNKKMEPWTRPMMDIFNEYYPMSIINNMIKDGIIEISPLAFMRGRTFKDAIIIADEMQNSSPNQMLMVLTRIGDASKLVITGDMKQADMKNSGLSDFLFHYHKGSSIVDGLSKHVKVVELNNSDIIRHHVVGKIIDMYQSNVPIESSNTTIVNENIKTVKEETVHSSVTESRKIPYFIGNYSTKTDSINQDCALIPLKEMRLTKKYDINNPRNFK